MLQYIILGAYVSLLVIGVILLNHFQKSFICRKIIHISIFGLWLLLINFIWPIWFIIFMGLLGLSAGTVYYIFTKRFSVLCVVISYGICVFAYPFVSLIIVKHITIALAIVSLGDGFAGLLGTLVPSDIISSRNNRTYFGSFIMFLTCSLIFLIYQTFWPIALLAAAILTIAEYLSPSEFDNACLIMIAIPLIRIIF